MTAVRVALASAGFALALGGAIAPYASAQSVHIHVRVDTQGAPGQQVSQFRAFTTADEGGTQPVTVSRLCVKGIGHQVQEKCEDDVSAVELVERAVGLQGVSSRCVEVVGSAVWRSIPLTATARACP